jgi:hypothetical protein
MSITQQEIFDIFSSYLIDGGRDFYKTGLVLVRRAKPGEYIETWTADGLETTNYAKPGDFVLKNLQTEYQEEYVVTEDMFFKRYKFFYFSDDDHAVYMPTGKIRAAIYYGEELSFIAKWGRPMVLKTGDYIVSPYPTLDEIYRIAGKEFYETYESKPF